MSHSINRITSFLIVALVIFNTTKESFAQYWSHTTTEVLSPTSIIADDSGEKLFLSFFSNAGLWDCNNDVFANLNFELTSIGDYSSGTFYHLNTPGSFLLHADAPLSIGDGFLQYTPESGSWSAIAGLHDEWVRDFYLDPDSTTIFSLMYNDSILMSQDLMLTHESSYFPSTHNLRSFFRAGTDYYCNYSFWESDSMRSAIAVYNHETHSWDMDNPVFSSTDHFESGYASIIFAKPIANGEILISGYTVDHDVERFNIICNSLWEIETWIDDEDVNGHFFFQLQNDHMNPGALYAKISKTGIYYSEDNGRNWEPYSASGLPEDIMSVLEIYQQPQIGDLYVSTQLHGVFKSINSGESWQRIDIPDMIGSGNFSIQNEYVCVSGDNSKWRYFGHENWESVQITDPDFYHIYHRDQLYLSGDTLFGFIDVLEDTAAGISKNLAFSSDGGNNWTFRPYSSEYANSIRMENGIRIVSHNRIEYPFYHYSEDFGQSWTPLDVPGYKFTQSENYFYSVLRGTSSDSLIVRKHVSGNEWESLGLSGGSSGRLVMFPYDEESLLVYSAPDPWMDGGFCNWFDGEEWVQVGQTNFPLYPDLIFEYNNQTIVMFNMNETESITISTDSCQTYERLYLDFPLDIPIRAYSYDLGYDDTNNLLWVRTDFGLLWCPVEEILDVDDHVIQLQPADPTLFTNYPNPFNASTRIQYHLTQPGNVKLDVYDITGRLVKTLENTYKPSGMQSTFLDGTGLASGTYFIKLDTGSEVRNRRITLVK